MNTPSFQEELAALEAQISGARARVAELENEVRVVEEELGQLTGQREKYLLLTQICESLSRLEEIGASQLFWGELNSSVDEKALLARALSESSQFNGNIENLEARKQSLAGEIEHQLGNVDELIYEIGQLQDLEEQRKWEFLVEREVSTLPYRVIVMPWDLRGEDEKRFRKVISLALLVTMVVGGGMSVWKLPPPDKRPVVELPERLVKLVKNEPPPPPPTEQKKPEEKPEEKVAEKKPQEKPTEAEVKQARAKAETSGILAFKNNFADLMDSSDMPKLGADAKLGADMRKDAGAIASGLTQQRSLVVAQASGGSGGINTASLSRDVGTGAGGKNMGGVAFARVQDSIGTDAAEADRPLSDGPGPSRTDEEIQIVFDRYKAALYRIYNRELRNDPTLRGKMVLRITIESNGEVSAVKVESTDLKSTVLSAEILDRVKKFNFGAKPNVPKITILYPIDFLPAS